MTAVFNNTTNSIYKNGILAGTFSNPTVATTLTLIGIGAFMTSTTVGNYYFKGSIGSVRVYNRALSADEILQNYNATKGRFGL